MIIDTGPYLNLRNTLRREHLNWAIVQKPRPDSPPSLDFFNYKSAYRMGAPSPSRTKADNTNNMAAPTRTPAPFELSEEKDKALLHFLQSRKEPTPEELEEEKATWQEVRQGLDDERSPGRKLFADDMQ